MKIREVRAIMERLAAVHGRLGSQDVAIELQNLSRAIQSCDEDTIAAFLKKIRVKKR
jgi:hypothetical protein